MQYLSGKLSRRKDTLDTALFHELTHALHCATGDLKDKNTAILDYVYGFDEIKFWWTEREKPNDEELYNIVRRKTKFVESIEIIKTNLDNFFVDAVP